MDIFPIAFNALRSHPQFIIYKLVPSIERPGKTDKIPLNSRTGVAINPQDSSAWVSPEEAITAAKRHGSGYGVGYVFTTKDPFWFLDIDDCLDTVNSKWSPLAEQLSTVFNGAAIEISSSGKGLHIIGTGTAPAHICKDKFKPRLNIEFYTEGRFCALTGVRTAGDAAMDFTDKLPWLVNAYFPITAETTKQAWTYEPCAEWSGPTDDADLIQRALRVKTTQSIFGDKASFADLWSANYSVLENAYGSDKSSYDGALAMHLAFWTGNNCERILTIIQQSALYREKWERIDYLRTTILTACAKQKKFCNDTVRATQETTLKFKSLFLNIDEQKQLFAGCVWIQDADRILIPGGYMLKPSQFRARFGGYNYMMGGENSRITRNAWEAFTENQAHEFPRVISTSFRPDLTPGLVFDQNGEAMVNNYYPIEVPRKIGDATPFLQHVKKLIPDERDRIILLSYLAACVQYKGRKFNWCPFIQGTEGNGKTLLTLCTAYAIGEKFVHFPEPSQLTEKYNDWLLNKILIGIEDIFVSDSATEVMEILKLMITAKQREIRAMHTDKITRRICCNFILNSNHKDGIRKTARDRRYAPFYTPQQEAEDLIRDGMTKEYFFALYDWLEKDGYAIVSEFLHTYIIPDEFNPALGGQAPLTTATNAAIEHSRGGLEQEIQEAVGAERVGFRGGWISSHYLNLLFCEIKANRFPHSKRKEILKSLGYDYHIALTEGRVNNVILPDGIKSKLFIKRGHLFSKLTNAADVAREYTAAQSLL